VRRLLEMTRGDDALWPYAAFDDPAFRAALDVVAPGLSTFTAVDSAPSPPPASDAALGDSVSLQRLQEWTVRRYVGREVREPLPPGDATGRPPARLEGRLTADTLVAVHFASTPFQPAYGTGGAVHLADPSGVTTPLSGAVVARLPFRAPVVPNPDAGRDAEWRHGWAYLVVLPPATARAHRGGFAGWRLVSAASPSNAVASGVRDGRAAAADRTRISR
jgi:hypothetical protein